MFSADSRACLTDSSLNALCGLAILAGVLVIARVVPPFLKKGEERHILERLVEQGESVQKEYTPPTPECPHPELWKMMDSQTSELEVLDFLKSLVITIKPQLIVETGTFLGYGTLKMAEGLKENGFGRIITIEYDPAIFAKAKERIDASGLGSWIEIATSQASIRGSTGASIFSIAIANLKSANRRSGNFFRNSIRAD